MNLLKTIGIFVSKINQVNKEQKQQQQETQQESTQNNNLTSKIKINSIY